MKRIISGMNLNMYIPFREAIILYNNEEIPILGISEFKIEIDRLQAFYKVWVSTTSGQSIANIDASILNVINMTPSEDLDASASLKIDEFTTPCKIRKCDYNHMKHAYSVSLYFILNRDVVRTYIYEKDDDLAEEHTRFDILDL